MSPITGADLLKALGSGVRPAGVGPDASSGVDGLDFAKLLKDARGGTATSGLPVTLPASLGVELDANAHERLSAAVDRLEAAGAQRGVVLLDGQAMLVNVGERAVESLVSADAGAMRIDAIVRADGKPGDGEGAPADPGDPLWRLANDGLARLLAG